MSQYASLGFRSLLDELRAVTAEISCEQMQLIMSTDKPYALIDVRETHEVQFGSIPDALHVSKGVIERDLEKLIPDKNVIVIVFCAVGARSLISAYMLQKMGYKYVYSLKGGFNEWLRYTNSNT